MFTTHYQTFAITKKDVLSQTSLETIVLQFQECGRLWEASSVSIDIQRDEPYIYITIPHNEDVSLLETAPLFVFDISHSLLWVQDALLPPYVCLWKILLQLLYTGHLPTRRPLIPTCAEHPAAPCYGNFDDGTVYTAKNCCLQALQLNTLALVNHLKHVSENILVRDFLPWEALNLRGLYYQRPGIQPNVEMHTWSYDGFFDYDLTLGDIELRHLFAATFFIHTREKQSLSLKVEKRGAVTIAAETTPKDLFPLLTLLSAIKSASPSSEAPLKPSAQALEVQGCPYRCANQINCQLIPLLNPTEILRQAQETQANTAPQTTSIFLLHVARHYFEPFTPSDVETLRRQLHARYGIHVCMAAASKGTLPCGAAPFCCDIIKEQLKREAENLQYAQDEANKQEAFKQEMIKLIETYLLKPNRGMQKFHQDAHLLYDYFATRDSDKAILQRHGLLTSTAQPKRLSRLRARCKARNPTRYQEIENACLAFHRIEKRRARIVRSACGL